MDVSSLNFELIMTHLEYFAVGISLFRLTTTEYPEQELLRH